MMNMILIVLHNVDSINEMKFSINHFGFRFINPLHFESYYYFLFICCNSSNDVCISFLNEYVPIE